MPKKRDYCNYRNKDGICCLSINQEYLNTLPNVDDDVKKTGFACNSSMETYCIHRANAKKQGIKND